MFQHHLDQALEPVAGRFDPEIVALGEELERHLGPDQRRLLDDLEGMHFRRAGALASASFDVGVEVGKALSAHANRLSVSRG